MPFLAVCAKRDNFATMIKTNSLHAWWLASRPKTLSGAAAPVMVALAIAWHEYGHISWVPATLCMLFALLMQTLANFVNDYFDCVNGVDGEERLGPQRACSQGWITLPRMRLGIAITTLLSCLTGLPLVAWGGWECIAVGLACVLFCFLYTTLFSRIAMGDILVVLFFGLVPVSYTFYFQSPYVTIAQVPSGVWLLAIAQGLITDCLLLVNNFRDRDTDATAHKTTLVTIIGPEVTLWLYGIIGLLSTALAMYGIFSLSGQYTILHLLPLLFLPLHACVLFRMRKVYSGKTLNQVLGMTAMSILMFAVIVSISLICAHCALCCTVS